MCRWHRVGIRACRPQYGTGRELLRRRIRAGAQLALLRDQCANIGKDGTGRGSLNGALDRQVGAKPAQQVERLFTELTKLAVPLGQV